MSSKTLQRAQIPVKGSDMCPIHQSEFLFSCTDCGGELVCMECITSSHQRHAFDKLADVAMAEKEVIKAFVDRAEISDLPKLDGTIASFDKQIEENLKHYGKMVENIKSQGNVLKNLIDEDIEKKSKLCKDSERKNHDLLLARSREYISIRDQLTKRIKYCKEATLSGKDIKVINAARDLKSKKPVKPLPPPILDTMTFMPRQVSDEEVSNLFGNVSQIIATFVHPSSIASVQKSSKESFWVSSNRDDLYISLVSTSGKVQKTVEFNSNVKDISVSPNTGNLWACCYDGNVYEVLTSYDGLTDEEAETPVKRFSFDSPISIAMTSQETVIVGSVNKVSLVTASGRTVNTVEEGTIIWPHHIAVCPLTGDIAICDGDLSCAGGDNKPHVIVLDKNLYQRYRHFGPFESQAQIERSEYHPVDVEYDDNGRLLIADHSMQCVYLHRMPGDGKFVSVVHTDEDKPLVLTLLTEGQLCLGFSSKVMKVIKY